jgi:hypothetical protein
LVEIIGTRVLVVKPEGKRTRERSNCRCEGYIKLDPKQTRCYGVDWMHRTKVHADLQTNFIEN